MIFKLEPIEISFISSVLAMAASAFILACLI